MRLTLVDIFKSASGKVCQDSDFYTVTRNGKTYTGKVCHPYTGEPTAKQVAMNEKFKRVTTAVNRILKMGKGSDDYDLALMEYKSNPGKYDTLRGWLFGKKWKEME